MAPRGPSKRVRIAREGITALGLAIADGMLEAGQRIVEVANPPDSPLPPYPIGQGLPVQGGVLVYVDGQKVAGWHQRGNQPKKPRAAKADKGAIVAIVGFGFPGRFQETGTAHHAAQPFLGPAADQVTPEIPGMLGQRVKGLR